jgi:7-carboxy-7-deazaguanine synthase
MTYSVKEIFYTLQGEGANTGRASVFCRFAGCNLWSGREEDRSRAVCKFCDTDFFGTNGTDGGKFATAEDLAQRIERAWLPEDCSRRFVVLTGGEPLLQVDAALVAALHAREFEIAVETNGTVEPPAGLDWICVSPKASERLVVRSGNELKLVYPQLENRPDQFEHLAFDHFFLQPMDGPEREKNTKAAIEYCQRHPAWRLAVQTHKMIGVR